MKGGQRLSVIGIFWRQHPALLYAFSCLLGLHIALHWKISLLIPLSIFLIPLGVSFFYPKERLRSRILLFALVLLASFIYVKSNYVLPEVPDEGVFGNCAIEISSVSTSKSYFGKSWVFRGTIKSFVPDNSSFEKSVAKNAPFYLHIPWKDGQNRPLADNNYRIHAKLKKPNGMYYTLQIKKNEPWHPIAHSWNLAENRYRLKEFVSEYIQNHITGHYAATFLAGIATGDFDDRILKHEFSRFGLQHIMAISGFHFGIIASILSIFLRLFCPPKKAALLLALVLSSYFVFLGCGPSIMRAWMTILIVLVGQLLEKKSTALNSMGIALIVIFLFDPLMCCSLGFQLSFLSTAAILFFFAGFDNLLQIIWIKRPLSKMIEMNRTNQHAFLVITFFRQAVALSLAVNMVALPMMLFYFQKFPLMSLIYNLFFPLMVSFSMLMLIVGLFLDSCFPYLGTFIHYLNSQYTHFMLNFTFNMPTSVDISLRMNSISEIFIITYLSVLFWGAIFWRDSIAKQKEGSPDFVFL